jgi:hypothetical protein
MLEPISTPFGWIRAASGACSAAIAPLLRAPVRPPVANGPRVESRTEGPGACANRVTRNCRERMVTTHGRYRNPRYCLVLKGTGAAHWLDVWKESKSR